MLNVVILMGKLVADSEFRHATSDIAVTSFTIVMDRSYVKSDAERQADFIDIIVWRSTVEFVCKYFREGQLIAVQGSIQTRSYQDKNGDERKAFEAMAGNVHSAGSKRKGGTPSPRYNSYSRPDAPMPSAPAYTNGNTGDFEETPTDDDLPF